jgi:hypothetical protein
MGMLGTKARCHSRNAAENQVEEKNKNKNKNKTKKIDHYFRSSS